MCIPGPVSFTDKFIFSTAFGTRIFYHVLLFLQPVELWTGKQLFGVLLRPHAKMRVYINLTVAEKTYSKPKGEKEKPKETMCPNDGFVYIRNSELISGQLGKATLGLCPFSLFIKS